MILDTISRRFSAMRFSADAHSAITGAHVEARNSSHDALTTGDLLLALLRVSGGALRILDELGVSPEQVQAEVQRLSGQGELPNEIDKVPFTHRAKRALGLALAEARRFGDRQIDTDHLLLALAAESGGIAERALTALGLDIERLRAAKPHPSA
jgi:ATP-dependent Clp protease ATP-binding subunit ClpC